MAATETRQGIGVSPGSAYGPVVQVAPPVRPPADEPAVDDHEAALADVKAAFEVVAVALEGKARHADDTAQQILKATALIARDKGLVKAADKQLAAGRGRATAIANAVEEYCVQFEALGGYFAERVTDLRDVGSRAVAAVLGVPAPGVPDFSEPSVVVAEDLAPAETATLDRSLVVGIVTQAGGRTSHTAILAAQMGIPAVVQLPGATGIPVGTPVALDGDTGEVTIAPDISLVEAQRVRREKRAEALAAGSGPGVTRDGHHVALLANIGGVQDAEAAGALDLEGVGLFRTEFVFLSADKAPTVDEQAEIYRKVFRPFGSRRVVVRTLDAGADKPLAFADLGPEENPALGRRGLRLSAERPELLDAQLEALAVAARDTGADVRVMAPMVATAEEAAWFARRVRENGLPKAGRDDRGARVRRCGPGTCSRRSTSAAWAPTTSRSTRWPPTGCRASCPTCSTRGSRRCSTSSPPRATVPDAWAARSGSAASRPATRCSRWCWPGSGCRACRWRRARCRSCGWPCRCTRLPECQGLATEAREARTAREALEAVRSRARTELTDLL